MTPYQPPWYLKNGVVQSLWLIYYYAKIWEKQGHNAYWLRQYPQIQWQEQVFRGAEDVPLWGYWCCPPQACGTVIINYGITGTTHTAWYAQTFARKAYAAGLAVSIYDWRSHGKSAELSPVPSSDGWREGVDQLRLAEQLVALGCPTPVVLTGFSLGGQLALWGLKAAVEENCPLIVAGGVLAPNLDSNRSLAYLESTAVGRAIDRHLTQELRQAARERQVRFPEAVKPGAVGRIDSIRGFDREMVIDYYGFESVKQYYTKTSPLPWLSRLQLPHLVIYAADDPMFAPELAAELEAVMRDNPNGLLWLTQWGGHVAHLSVPTATEDTFWGLNRLLEFAIAQIKSKVQ
ncbi:MAG: alpha/beta fold hydrolase [Jaaginema sp. PMC 1079.18]|nr:alpha/beta fold hydrolase [Jaaginema sp. PMC 1080.18]MEC4849491.1 alpha/beta fold hydrolase [Jaaginema sp. PMC 1079.18]MEC4866006.1 alpha/beta fold hydrolase [Jaaginema sp. PMC 1078.18]